jgi:DNA-directed RNA polymerase specialized sigma24 family protein
MIKVEEFDEMIRKMAWGCYRRLPPNYITIEGLEQEGRLAFSKLLLKRIDPNGAKFSTLLYRVLSNCYKDIIRKAYRKKNNHNIKELNENSIPCGVDPQYLLERKELFDYLRFFDEELADFFMYGPSDELKKYARRKRTDIDWKCIERFFGCCLSDLANNFNSGRLDVNGCFNVGNKDIDDIKS